MKYYTRSIQKIIKHFELTVKEHLSDSIQKLSDCSRRLVIVLFYLNTGCLACVFYKVEQSIVSTIKAFLPKNSPEVTRVLSPISSTVLC